MELEIRKFQGRVTTWLFMMDRELRDGQDEELTKAFRKLRREIQSDQGVSVPCLSSGRSQIIEICGMMFWVNCHENSDGVVNVFVSSRRKAM